MHQKYRHKSGEKHRHKYGKTPSNKTHLNHRLKTSSDLDGPREADRMSGWKGKHRTWHGVPVAVGLLDVVLQLAHGCGLRVLLVRTKTQIQENYERTAQGGTWTWDGNGELGWNSCSSGIHERWKNTQNWCWELGTALEIGPTHTAQRRKVQTKQQTAKTAQRKSRDKWPENHTQHQFNNQKENNLLLPFGSMMGKLVVGSNTLQSSSVDASSVAASNQLITRRSRNVSSVLLNRGLEQTERTVGICFRLFDWMFSVVFNSSPFESGSFLLSNTLGFSLVHFLRSQLSYAILKSCNSARQDSSYWFRLCFLTA